MYATAIRIPHAICNQNDSLWTNFHRTYHMSCDQNANWFRNLNLIYILLKIINALWIAFSIKIGQKWFFPCAASNATERLIIKCNLCCGKVLWLESGFWMSQFFTKLSAEPIQQPKCLSLRSHQKKKQHRAPMTWLHVIINTDIAYGVGKQMNGKCETNRARATIYAHINYSRWTQAHNTKHINFNQVEKCSRIQSIRPKVLLCERPKVT